ncbi:MAG: hypothetical protein JRG92_17540 [Deltaproteobacteria bacterium]|nr:hypothetical protein [Deltaproteobacteria bacterium]MBW2385439.1 hypothetical protein [Deltaproteobacteria bacterium]MBW2696411.1 hypothetical protein [Deltaproteobacteria bacterium]
MLVGACLLSGCAPTSKAYPNEFQRLWNEYEELSPKRAIAIAGDPYRLWLAGMSGGHATQAEANQAALDSCMKQRAKNRQQIPCRLYAEEDRLL